MSSPLSKGIDADCSLESVAGDLVKAGFSWVGRYIKPGMSKGLSLAEARHLSSMGLYILSIVELGFPTTVEHFTPRIGSSDAVTAVSYARNVLKQPVISKGTGLPTSLMITVDYDATESDQAAIESYFVAFNTVNKAHAVGGESYVLGVYGSGAICEFLKSKGLVTHTWLSESSGFRGSKTYTSWDIHQTGSGEFDRLSVDFNVSKPNMTGAWNYA